MRTLTFNVVIICKRVLVYAGRQYDGFGRLRDWFDPVTANMFNITTQCMKDKYSQYKVGKLAVSSRSHRPLSSSVMSILLDSLNTFYWWQCGRATRTHVTALPLYV